MTATPPTILGIKTTPTPAHFLAGAAASGSTDEAMIARLYSRGILTKPQVASAVVKLKLKLPDLARELGLPGVKELLAEFITDPTDTPVHNGQSFVPFTFDEGVQALWADRPDAEIGSAIGRTAKAVQSFRRRCFTQGLRLNRIVWELIQDGENIEDITSLGFQGWLVKFTETAFQLQVYARMHRLPELKIELVDGKH